MSAFGSSSSVISVQRLLFARLEAQTARVLAAQARRAMEMAPDGFAEAPARLVLQGAEQALARAERRVADENTRLNLLA